MDTANNKNAFSPTFISNTLHDISHRYVYVLECETRQYDKAAVSLGNKQKYTAPRFAIVGTDSGALQDPRNVDVKTLVPILSSTPIILPSEWSKLHHYIYLLQSNTDEHGWQYRSDWYHGTPKALDEQWVGENREGLDVRRRLWFITICQSQDVSKCKAILAESIRKHPRGIIMRGNLARSEQGTLMKSWVDRHIVLKDDRLEVYTTEKMDKRVAEYYIKGCSCKMLFGSQCPDREFAFSIRNNDGSIAILLDADTSREARRRWVVAISYQLSLLSPDMNFTAFDYGPPTGADALDRVLTCGELAKRGHLVKNWKNRFFKLTPTELQYYDREILKGAISIIDAELKFDDTLEFELFNKSSGESLIMRADAIRTKNHWVETIQEQLKEQNKNRQVENLISLNALNENPNASHLFQQQREAAAGGGDDAVDDVNVNVDSHTIMADTDGNNVESNIEIAVAVAEMEDENLSEYQQATTIRTSFADAAKEVTAVEEAKAVEAVKPVVEVMAVEEVKVVRTQQEDSVPATAIETDDNTDRNDQSVEATPEDVVIQAVLTEQQVVEIAGQMEKAELDDGFSGTSESVPKFKRGGAHGEIDYRRQSTCVMDNVKKFQSLINEKTDEVVSKPWVGRRGSMLSPPAPTTPGGADK